MWYLAAATKGARWRKESQSLLGPLNVYDSYGNFKGVLMSMTLSEATLRNLGASWRFCRSSSINPNQRTKNLPKSLLKYAKSVVVPPRDLPQLDPKLSNRSTYQQTSEQSWRHSYLTRRRRNE
jgi:hypothetical protein